MKRRQITTTNTHPHLRRPCWVKDKKVRTASFNSIIYDIDMCGPIDGFCDQPRNGKPSLRIMVDMETQRGLITLIHEALHASNFRTSEAVVDQTSTDIGRLLWRLGYRIKK